MEKKPISSFLIGQLVATAQLMEETSMHERDPNDDHVTVAEDCFNEVIEHPASALHTLEERLAPQRFRLSHIHEENLLKDMKLIYKIKDQYAINDEHLDEEEYLKGYFQQLKRYFKEDINVEV